MERIIVTSFGQPPQNLEEHHPIITKLPRGTDSCPPSPMWEIGDSGELVDAAPETSANKNAVLLNGSIITKRDLAPSSPPASSQQNAKSRRKCKRKLPKSELEELTDRKKQVTRAEKNRRFAKESRDRRKEYIKQLEDEVKGLKDEVAQYKEKLTKYENADKKWEEYGTMHKREMDSLKEKTSLKEKASLALPHNIPAMETLAMKHNMGTEERCKAITELSKTLVTIVNPIPQRYIMWSAENNSGCFDASYVHALAQANGATVEQLKECADSHVEGSRDFFAACAVQFRALIRDFINCQQGIQDMIRKVDEYIAKCCIPITNPQSLQFFLKTLEGVLLLCL